MGKTIAGKVIGEIAELSKDVVKKGAKEVTIMVKEGVQTAVGLQDIPSVTPEKMEEESRREQKTKAIGIPDQRRILEMAAREQADLQWQKKTRIQPQKGSPFVARQELSPVALPGSVSHQPGIPGFGRKREKKPISSLAPPLKSSVETKYAGRD